MRYNISHGTTGFADPPRPSVAPFPRDVDAILDFDPLMSALLYVAVAVLLLTLSFALIPALLSPA
ncbi:MAG TPA: hypothetical protein VKQ09_11690 [Sphingomonas sp.]|nr:hypothetical protein [Sphingomonas sp.]